MFKVDLQWKQTRILFDQAIFTDGALALEAYRDLLRRSEFMGKAVAARFSKNGKALYYSHFDRPMGQLRGRGRILPEAPLDITLDPNNDADRAKADELSMWTPARGKGVIHPVAPSVTASQGGAELSRSSMAILSQWLAPLAAAHPESFARVITASAADAQRKLSATSDPRQRAAILAAANMIALVRESAQDTRP